MADMRSLVLDTETPLYRGPGWTSEATYTTTCHYKNAGYWCEAVVTVRYQWLKGAMDVVAFQRAMDALEKEMTAEDLAQAALSFVAKACKGWIRVQVRSEIPDLVEPLTLTVKRSA